MSDTALSLLRPAPTMPPHMSPRRRAGARAPWVQPLAASPLTRCHAADEDRSAERGKAAPLDPGRNRTDPDHVPATGRMDSIELVMSSG